jgi:hypothetical protein
MLQRGFSRFGGANGEIVEVAPVTLPALSCLKVPVVDDGAERREIADKFAEFRTVRLGAECWQSISKSGSFENWSHIAKALLVGKNVALRASDTNRGRRYALVFSAWAQQHGFDRMPAATRSTAIQLGENLAAITQWRSTLPEPQRKRLTHPQSIVCRYQPPHIPSPPLGPPLEPLAPVKKLFRARMCLASDCGALPRANRLGFDLGSGQGDALIQLRVIGNFTLHAFTFGYKEFSHLLDFGH